MNDWNAAGFKCARFSSQSIQRLHVGRSGISTRGRFPKKIQRPIVGIPQNRKNPFGRVSKGSKKVNGVWIARCVLPSVVRSEVLIPDVLFGSLGFAFVLIAAIHFDLARAMAAPLIQWAFVVRVRHLDHKGETLVAWWRAAVGALSTSLKGQLGLGGATLLACLSLCVTSKHLLEKSNFWAPETLNSTQVYFGSTRQQPPLYKKCCAWSKKNSYNNKQ